MRGVVALQMDFQAAANRWRPLLGWLVFALGAALLGSVYVRDSETESKIAAARHRLEQRRHPAAPASSADTAEARAAAHAAKAATAVRDQLAVPWPQFFAGLEDAANEDVALLALHADPAARVFRLAGEARNFAALMAYVRRLASVPGFSDVQLAGYEVRQQDPRRPVAFSLSGTWMPAP